MNTLKFFKNLSHRHSRQSMKTSMKETMKTSKNSPSSGTSIKTTVSNKTSRRASHPLPISNSAYDFKYTTRDTRLFSLSSLIPDLPVPESDRLWFEKVNIAVRDMMNGPLYDASHDYEHIQRVVSEARRLWLAEKTAHIKAKGDGYGDRKEVELALTLYVAAMVHAVGDEKYIAAKPAPPSTGQEENGEEIKIEIGEHWLSLSDEAARNRDRQRDFLFIFLRKFGCPPAIAGPAAHIASLVSFSREQVAKELVAQECEAYPLLKYVQDADRLDGLGAMGIARACVFGGVYEPRRKNTILTVVKLMHERFEQYPALMKTEAGRKEAEKRVKYMWKFVEEMLRQADCEEVLEADVLESLK